MEKKNNIESKKKLYGVLAKRYLLIAELGSGGNADVWLALDLVKYEQFEKENNLRKQ